jgi:hypothetical protein
MSPKPRVLIWVSAAAATGVGVAAVATGRQLPVLGAAVVTWSTVRVTATGRFATTSTTNRAIPDKSVNRAGRIQRFSMYMTTSAAVGEIADATATPPTRQFRAESSLGRARCWLPVDAPADPGA